MNVTQPNLETRAQNKRWLIQQWLGKQIKSARGRLKKRGTEVTQTSQRELNQECIQWLNPGEKWVSEIRNDSKLRGNTIQEVHSESDQEYQVNKSIKGISDSTLDNSESVIRNDSQPRGNTIQEYFVTQIKRTKWLKPKEERKQVLCDRPKKRGGRKRNPRGTQWLKSRGTRDSMHKRRKVRVFQ